MNKIFPIFLMILFFACQSDEPGCIKMGVWYENQFGYTLPGKQSRYVIFDTDQKIDSYQKGKDLYYADSIPAIRGENWGGQTYECGITPGEHWVLILPSSLFPGSFKYERVMVPPGDSTFIIAFLDI